MAISDGGSFKILDSGTFTCNKCGKCYDWVYCDNSAAYENSIVDKSTSAMSVKSYVTKDNQIEITIFCPECGTTSVFYKDIE